MAQENNELYDFWSHLGLVTEIIQEKLLESRVEHTEACINDVQ